MIDRDELADSLRMACDWLVNVAQVQTEAVDEKPIAQGCPCYHYANWRGAMRNRAGQNSGRTLLLRFSAWPTRSMWTAKPDSPCLGGGTDVGIPLSGNAPSIGARGL